MKKTLTLTVALAAGIAALNAQIVNIPDANFKNALLNHYPVIDTSGDGEIQVSEAQAFTETMNVSYQNISDLTGIEEFTNVRSLYCINNLLTELDISNNTALEYLNCGFNQLTVLNVNNNTALVNLSCYNNQLTTLDVSNNVALEYLSCGNNPLITVDISGAVALEYLSCWDNQLTALDVSNNTALQYLNFVNNQLTSLDVSNNIALEYLNCEYNRLTSLDVSNNTALQYLNCFFNQLTSLNIANGNNTALLSLRTRLNPDLICIEVDNEAYSTANWTGMSFLFDPQHTFSENCSGILSLNEPFSDASIGLYPNPANEFATITNLPGGSVVSILDVTGKTVHNSTAETENITISTENFVTGIYIVHIEYNGNTATQKLVVNR